MNVSASVGSPTFTDATAPTNFSTSMHPPSLATQPAVSGISSARRRRTREDRGTRGERARPNISANRASWKEVRPMADHCASGTWQVKQGCDQEFIDRWTEFLQWSRANYPSILGANFIRDRRVPGHYVSFAEWTDEASRDT
ncbi:antibiotic biosynthesis monooxygenase [Pseudarthrobacter sp. S9]|uniref:antibiotic biosynthesis monooxygenase n=1 Tax=Pseudarthrobacter sp. S9 TaxID=3418421 RepID=UPI003CFD3313